MDNRGYGKILRTTKIYLFFLILGIAIVGKRTTTWPIITWPVYSTYSEGFPASIVEAVELRVYSKSGELYVLKPSDIMTRGRKNISKAILNYAFESDDPHLANVNRVYLAQTILRILKGIDIESVECWKLTWDVSPLSLPPLDRDNPVNEMILGSFVIDDYLLNKSE